MRRSRLYLATRSGGRRAGLDLAGMVATARSAMVVSSVSPERWEMTVGSRPAASAMVSRVSVSVPIWLTLIRIALRRRARCPRAGSPGW